MRNLMLILLLCITGVVHAATIAGSVTDTRGTPIPGINVEVFQIVGGANRSLGIFVTSPTGTFTVTTPFLGNVRALVNWDFPIGTPVFPNRVIHYNGRKVVTNAGAITATLPSTPVLTPSTKFNIAGLAVLNVSMKDVFDARHSGIVLHLQQCVTMLAGLRGGAPWTINYDIPFWSIFPSNGSFYWSVDKAMYIGTNVVALGVQSDIYHEMGHLIQDHIYRLVSPGGPHTFDTVLASASFAMSEGWGDYIGALGGITYANVDPKFSGQLEGPGKRHVWRGLAVAVPAGFPAPPPANDGSDNNGERIENNIASILHVGTPYSFGDNITVLVNAKPQTFFDFYQGAINLPQGEPLRDQWMTHCERLGVVYSRMAFSSTARPFTEPVPSNVPVPGNCRQLRNVWYGRGTTTANMIQQTALQLNASQIVPVVAARLLYKTAANTAQESAQPSTRFTPSTAAGVAAPFDVKWDTTTVADNRYDIVAQGRSNLSPIHWDSLFPEFLGDANIAADNTDEKWLKRVSTWWSAGRVRTDNAAGDEAGRVNIDNTPPKIKAGSVIPPPNP